MEQEWIAAMTDGGPLTMREILRYAKQNGELNFLYHAIRASLIKQQAALLNISASVDELQDAADAFRIKQRLFTEEATNEWLATNQMTLDDLEARALHSVLREKLSHAVTAGKVEPYFQEHQDSLELFTLSYIQTADEGIARELHLLIAEDGEDFHSLAREYSEDEATRLSGGHLGVFTRAELPPFVPLAVCDARPGQLLAPVLLDGAWRLFKIEARQRAVLDEETYSRLQEQLFALWLRERERGVQVLLFASSE